VWAPGALHRFPSPEAAQGQLEQAAARLTEDLGVDVGWDLLHGAAVPETIVADAERHLASLVALAVRPHPVVQRVLGSTAVAVAHVTTAAVLAVPCPRPGTSTEAASAG
jgi:nucleotide-binding universal stress UspA family protein